MNTLVQTVVESPLGPITLVASDDGLAELRLPGGRRHAGDDAPSCAAHPVLALAAAELRAYLDGTLRAFTTPLRPEGTRFQRDVWRALTAIPFGATCTYSELAAAVGRPSAVRAVGAANGRNPLPIVVPCHRVVGADGTLVGYSGGLDAKRLLLALEQRARASSSSARPASALFGQ